MEKLKINKKLAWLSILFLLIMPFRLPISVGFIKITVHITNSVGSIAEWVTFSNVLITKIVYDFIIAAFFVYYFELLSVDIMGRRAGNGNKKCPYWWTYVIAVLWFIYIIYDVLGTYELLYHML